MNYTQQEYNIKCAEFMGWQFYFGKDFVNAESESKSFPTKEFNPYSDANDRNKVIEKMRVSTVAITNQFGHKYFSCTCNAYGQNAFADEDMEAAQNACIWAVLESES